MAAYFAEGTEAMQALEQMVDRTSVAMVLQALACICREKADHLDSNWQDRGAARIWQREAGKLEKFAPKLDV